MTIGHGNSDWDEVPRDPKELHKNIDTTGSVDQLDYLEQVMALAMSVEMTTVAVLSNID